MKAIREAGLYGKDGKRTQSGPMFQCLIDMAYLCWQRSIDIRVLKESQIDEPNKLIRFAPSKTLKSSGKIVDILMTPEIEEVLEARTGTEKAYGIISPYVFPTRKGSPYTRSGLFSMWDRARERAKLPMKLSSKTCVHSALPMPQSEELGSRTFKLDWCTPRQNEPNLH